MFKINKEQYFSERTCDPDHLYRCEVDEFESEYTRGSPNYQMKYLKSGARLSNMLCSYMRLVNSNCCNCPVNWEMIAGVSKGIYKI